MEKYISFTVPSDSAISTVGQVLRAQGHLTKKADQPRQISSGWHSEKWHPLPDHRICPSR